MTNPTSPSAKWGTMNDEQKIAFIATKIMGWKQHCRNTAHWVDADKSEGFDYVVRACVWTEKYHCRGDWNPLKDWNHTMQVIEQAGMDGFDLQSDLVSTQEEICEEIFTIYHQQK